MLVCLGPFVSKTPLVQRLRNAISNGGLPKRSKRSVTLGNTLIAAKLDRLFRLAPRRAESGRLPQGARRAASASTLIDLGRDIGSRIMPTKPQPDAIP